MTMIPDAAMGDLLRGGPSADMTIEPLAEGAVVLRRWAEADVVDLLTALETILAAAPFRHMTTPGGYRYDASDPTTGRQWPAMPSPFCRLAERAAVAAGFDGFAPDSCLINRYEPGTRLSLHQDRNERDFTAPIVSVSLGLPAVFLFGGLRRSDRPRRLRLESGDIVVWGGPARLAFHGVDPLAEGDHPLTGRCRINLTFRKAL